MTEPNKLTFAEQKRLAMEVDLRLLDVWAQLFEDTSLFTDENTDLLAASLRLAYVRGYLDALHESGHERGALHEEIRR